MMRPKPIEPTGWSEAIYPVFVLSLAIVLSAVIYRQVAELIAPREWPGPVSVAERQAESAGCGDGAVLMWRSASMEWTCETPEGLK
jgi:hypothetical protein